MQMNKSTISTRSPRSTRAALAREEARQSQVIAALFEAGHPKLADRLARCQRARVYRGSGWPWRCRRAGCWACRRAAMRGWWRDFRSWIGDSDSSLAIIPLTGDPITAVRKLRKALRDVRDRTARRDARWRGVLIAGFASDGSALVLIRHDGISRMRLWSVLNRRWPDVRISDVSDIQPSTSLPVEQAVGLAMARRGTESIRIVVPAQRLTAAPKVRWDDECWPMAS
jgi:hypothetical protein